MKIMRNLLPALLGAIFICTAAGAQELDYGVDYKVRFDNREYKSEYSPDKTFFSMKLVPEAGLKWGENRIMGGLDATRHFGAKEGDQPDIEPLLYYAYDNKRNFKAYAGVFQRSKMTLYPAVILTGSKNFYDPNVEGAMFRYYGDCGFMEVACDWYSMITDSQRERFVIYSAGNLGLKKFSGSRLSAGYYASMHHIAGSATERGVVDNILTYPYLEYRFNVGMRPEWRGLATSFNSFLRAGWVQTFQNDRVNEDKFLFPNGFIAEVQVGWRRFGIYETLYLGDNLMPFYARLGSATYLGDTFYRTENDMYSRLEVFWNPKLGDRTSLKISSVHHYDGKTWNWQQVATFSVALTKK